MSKRSHFAERIAQVASRWSGSSPAFLLAALIVVVWLLSGPLFGFSDTWQLVINTSTTIVTFLMVFLIQNTQNRDGAAIQTKLDEIIRTSSAQNTYIGIEHLTEEELAELREKCEARAREGKLGKAQKAADYAADRAVGLD